jgi:hypothetical protein
VMKNFIVYNNSGDILRSGLCSDIDFDKQAKEGEYILEGVGSVDGNMVDVETKEILVKTKTQEELQFQFIFELRSIRNTLLAHTDWTQVSDAPLTKAKKDKYKSYRKALRDLPLKYDTITSIEEVNFPSIEDF